MDGESRVVCRPTADGAILRSCFCTAPLEIVLHTLLGHRYGFFSSCAGASGRTQATMVSTKALMLIGKTGYTAKEKIDEFMEYVSKTIEEGKLSGSVRVAHCCSNDFEDDELHNDIIVVLERTDGGVFDEETSRQVFGQTPPFIVELKIKCVSQSYLDVFSKCIDP